MEIAEKISRHLAFLEQRNDSGPLLGFEVGWSSHVELYAAFEKNGVFSLNAPDKEQLAGFYIQHFANMQKDDELFRDVSPLPIFPWVEAAGGCSVKYSGKDLWAVGDPCGDNETVTDEAVFTAYRNHLDLLTKLFPNRPVAAPLMRGVLDTLSACVGTQNAMYALVDDELHDQLVKQITHYSELLERFADIDTKTIAHYCGGFVSPRFRIWAPDRFIRVQEDVATLIAPSVFEEFSAPYLKKLIAKFPYSIMHIHSAAFHQLDTVLKLGMTVVHVVKDPGNATLEKMLPGLKKIQNAGKCICIKGQFTTTDLECLARELDRRSLCLELIVSNRAEADHAEAFIRRVF